MWPNNLPANKVSTLMLESTWIIHNFDLDEISTKGYKSGKFESKLESNISWNLSIVGTFPTEGFISFIITISVSGEKEINCDKLNLLSPYDHSLYSSIPLQRNPILTHEYSCEIASAEMKKYIKSMTADKTALIELIIDVKLENICAYESIYLVSNSTNPCYTLNKQISFDPKLLRVNYDDEEYDQYNLTIRDNYNFGNGLCHIEIRGSQLNDTIFCLSIAAKSISSIEILGVVDLSEPIEVLPMALSENISKNLISRDVSLEDPVEIKLNLKIQRLIDSTILDIQHEILYSEPNFLSLCKTYSTLVDQDFSDIVFVGNDAVEVKAHKCILSARNSIFKVLLSAPMKEKETNRIEIADFSSDTIRAMLIFIYSGICCKENPIELLAIAHKYDLIELQTYCARRLFMTINPANAPGLLAIMERYGLCKFKKLVHKYIMDNISTIIGNDGWNQWIKPNTDLTISMLMYYVETQCKL